ncbi:ZIP family metal transporter [Candidatus Nomurabacteria bacterium]|nr:ZIP family metal transporter [Candidatus Nomurabacteria bacterium]MCB9820507.1 ZIP family metal transporter [Candidatus Nomurabacteria bacterium]
MYFYPLIAALLVSVVSLSGALFLAGPLKKLLNMHLSYLSSFSAGVYIVTAILIILEASESLSIGFTILFVSIGFVLFFALEKLIPEAHHCSHDGCDTTHNEKFASKVLLSDYFHNIGDGILIAASFSASVSIGILVTLSIVVHEFVQEISEFILLKEAGYSNRKALYRNFIVALSVFLGVGLGLLIKDMHVFESIILAIASGALLQVVFVDILPHKTQGNFSHIMRHSMIFVFGVIVILGIRNIVPHTHVLEDEHGHHENEDENENDHNLDM